MPSLYNDELGSCDAKLDYGLFLSQQAAPVIRIDDLAEYQPEKFQYLTAKLGIDTRNTKYQKDEEKNIVSISFRK